MGVPMFTKFIIVLLDSVSAECAKIVLTVIIEMHNYYSGNYECHVKNQLLINLRSLKVSQYPHLSHFSQLTCCVYIIHYECATHAMILSHTWLSGKSV